MNCFLISDEAIKDLIHQIVDTCEKEKVKNQQKTRDGYITEEYFKYFRFNDIVIRKQVFASFLRNGHPDVNLQVTVKDLVVYSSSKCHRRGKWIDQLLEYYERNFE